MSTHSRVDQLMHRLCTQLHSIVVETMHELLINQLARVIDISGIYISKQHTNICKELSLGDQCLTPDDMYLCQM